MKAALFFTAIGWMMFLACERLSGDPVKRFIPGTYIRHFKNEFARGSDTIVIEPLEGNHYAIVKRSGYRRLRECAWLSVENRGEQWLGVYHPTRGIIEETQRGKIFRFVPKKNQLMVGTSVYEKMK